MKYSNNPLHLTTILRSIPAVIFLIKRVSFFEPNYGPLWFRCQEFFLSPPKEVLYRSFHLTALEIATNHSLYYEAMLRSAQKHSSRSESPEFYKSLDGCSISQFRKQFSYSFKPDYMFVVASHPKQLFCQTKILYGANQLDNWVCLNLYNVGGIQLCSTNMLRILLFFIHLLLFLVLFLVAIIVIIMQRLEHGHA